MGDIIATFKSSGKIPVPIDLLKIVVNDEAIMHAESFKSSGGILSCPVALDAFRVDSSLSTSTSLTICNSNFK